MSIVLNDFELQYILAGISIQLEGLNRLTEARHRELQEMLLDSGAINDKPYVNLAQHKAELNQLGQKLYDHKEELSKQAKEKKKHAN